MLDMGFIPDIERICKLVPFTRQTLFFTATMPPEIRRITEQFLHNPVKVEVSKPATTGRQYRPASGQDRPRAARQARYAAPPHPRGRKASRTPSSSAIASARVATLHRSLVRHGFTRCALHGDMDQSARTAALEQFRKGEVTLARSPPTSPRAASTFPAVSHVFNFDVPHHPDDYVHRIGRTGRAGRTGTAITVVARVRYQEASPRSKLIGQSIPWMARRVAQPGARTHRRQPSPEGEPHRGTHRHGEPRGEQENAQQRNGEHRGGRRHGRSAPPRRDGVPAPICLTSMMRGPAARPILPRSPLMPTTAPDICRPALLRPVRIKA